MHNTYLPGQHNINGKLIWIIFLLLISFGSSFMRVAILRHVVVGSFLLACSKLLLAIKVRERCMCKTDGGEGFA